VIVRRAIATDWPRVLVMARSFHAFARIPLAFDEAHAKAMFTAMRFNTDGLVIVADVDGEVRAVMVAMVAPSLLSPVKVAQEMMMWIEPDTRGGRAFVLMVRAFEEWAMQRGARMLGLAGMRNGSDVAGMYARLGYEQTETYYGKVI